jgi:hypothetical protein
MYKEGKWAKEKIAYYPSKSKKSFTAVLVFSVTRVISSLKLNFHVAMDRITLSKIILL